MSRNILVVDYKDNVALIFAIVLQRHLLMLRENIQVESAGTFMGPFPEKPGGLLDIKLVSVLQKGFGVDVSGYRTRIVPGEIYECVVCVQRHIQWQMEEQLHLGKLPAGYLIYSPCPIVQSRGDIHIPKTGNKEEYRQCVEDCRLMLPGVMTELSKSARLRLVRSKSR